MGNQQYEDARKHGIESLNTIEPKWAYWMGRCVYDTCKESLERPMRLLVVFETAGKKAESRSEFLHWTVPLTNFPAVQHYTEGAIKKIWLQYGPPVGEILNTKHYINTFQCNVQHQELQVYSKGKQSQGASPNVIHSLDAAHLMLTVNKCSFPVTTIHDSFGCHLADMPELFVVVRETFIELYKNNPLESIMADIEGDISGLEIGSLDIDGIQDSEYCFC
jgi:DNA-directed RNA polymerase